MNTIRAIVVDDEILARESLSILLNKEEDITVVEMCANGMEAIAAVQTHKPDVLFLDIQMPGIDGFEVLEELVPDERPIIVFVTAHDEFALRAFEVHALDYLLKPYSQQRLNTTLQRIRQLIDSGKDDAHQEALASLIASVREAAINESRPQYLERLMIPVSNGYTFVETADIEWIEGADYYVKIHSGGSEYLYRERLKHLEQKLDPGQFLRVHISHIVNLNNVRALHYRSKDDLQIEMAAGAKINVSRSRKKTLLALGKDRFGLPDV